MHDDVLEKLRLFGFAVTHDVRTPLSTINMASQLINAELNKNDYNKEKVISYLEKVDAEVKSLFSITDIISARLRNPQNLDEFEVFSVKTVVDMALNEYPFSGANKEHVFLKLTDNFDIYSDKNAVRHVLFVLLQSALYNINQYKKKEIVITSVSRNENNIVSFKELYSCGNCEKVQDSIFDLVLEKQYRGSNLGMYFCKEIMKAICGEIYYEVVENEYTEFVLVFPKNTVF